MTYHSSMSSLLCHQCGRRRANPETCPECGSNLIRYLGVGTQKVVAELERFFPELRVLRWDRDTARSNADHTELLERFVAGDADVLVGTQMIAKGLDMPGVGLVGVVSADVGLNVPDFRAAERTYQTLLQVIGRAGRRGEAGTAIVQTYQPESAVLQSLANGNYRAFADRELAFRQEHNNPPYVRLARLVFTHADINVVGRETDKLRVALRRIVDGSEVGRVSYVGPASCFFGKVRSKYRWQIVLRGQHLQRVVTELPLGPGWSVDIDPANLL
jgi:primosomal protein N' (replication factor Y)